MRWHPARPCMYARAAERDRDGGGQREKGVADNLNAVLQKQKPSWHLDPAQHAHPAHTVLL